MLILASAADLQALVGVFLPQQRLPGNQPGKGWNWGDRNRGGPGEGLTGDFKVEQAINRGTSTGTTFTSLGWNECLEEESCVFSLKVQ